MRVLALPLLLIGAATAAWAAPPVADTPIGTWENPKHTIAVRVEQCGNELCGKIVNATPEAMADAREAGVTNLIGTQLLRDYRPSGRQRWSGTVYVPDMGRSFSSHIVQSAPNTLRISGCLIAGFLCKSQDWTRV
ncbi:DUF2147 domain-containing protein [Sphingomonas sp. dw_22]|uniref:DUF2147 domain-containing protein n=1 Tax=Sphingomonas sp. dw_22 TaxID=2721175 RepID=UPI001BD3B49C|nr:DUF2147 domain-containing protein [Sphingomonas sp. dw_22]